MPDRELQILLCGTGGFGARIAYDIIAYTKHPTILHVVGRNEARLAWLASSGNGRANIFRAPVRVIPHVVDLSAPEAVAALLNQVDCDVVVQTASAQPVSVLRSTGNAWMSLVKQGGYGASLVFQAINSARMARAMRAAGSRAHLINCCFPDAVNPLLKAMELPVTAGVGNIAILSNILQGSLPAAERSSLRMLAHYRNLHDWRCDPADRREPACRIWLENQEVDHVYERFPIRLATEPVPDVSGASAAPAVFALAAGLDWTGHLPGPLGLPGGYPVRIEAGQLSLDLPEGLSESDAIAFNAQFEKTNGVSVRDGERVVYSGELHAAISRYSSELAKGFAVDDLDAAFADMSELRDRLSAQL